MSKTGEKIFMRKDGRWEARYVYRRETGKAKYGYIYSTACKEAKLRRYVAQSKHLNSQTVETEPKILVMQHKTTCGP